MVFVLLQGTAVDPMAQGFGKRSFSAGGRYFNGFVELNDVALTLETYLLNSHNHLTMKLQNNIALKEWAVVLKALEEGKQTILLRKGGIAEEGGEFKPDHSEFFLYPTFEHENAQAIKPDWRPRLAAIEKENKDPKRIHFRLYATLDKVEKVTDWEVAKRLIPFTVMSDEAVEKRFNYGDWAGF